MNLRILFITIGFMISGISAHAKETVKIDIQINSKTTYSKQTDGQYIGDMDALTVSIQEDSTTADGVSQSQKLGPFSSDGPSNDQLSIDVNTVVSKNNGQSVVFPATISEKEIRVLSKDILKISAESFKAKSQSLITQLQLKSTTAGASFDIKSSDLVCQRGPKLDCELSVEMVIQSER